MPDIVKIAAQVDVYDARLLLNDGSGYPIDRFMCCPFGTVSIRSRLEVCLEDWLQDELERTLHHPIPDRRHDHIELHFYPTSLRVPLRSPIPSILCAASGLPY